MYDIYCKLRDAKKVRDSEVAKATGITKSTFSDWKSGRSNPKQDKLQKIAEYFGVPLEYFTSGKSSASDWQPALTAKDEKEPDHGRGNPRDFRDELKKRPADHQAGRQGEIHSEKIQEITEEPLWESYI